HPALRRVVRGLRHIESAAAASPEGDGCEDEERGASSADSHDGLPRAGSRLRAHGPSQDDDHTRSRVVAAGGGAMEIRGCSARRLTTLSNEEAAAARGWLVARTGYQPLTPMRRLCSVDRKSTRLNSSHGSISYAVFRL